jgi:hypothetical protein
MKLFKYLKIATALVFLQYKIQCLRLAEWLKCRVPGLASSNPQYYKKKKKIQGLSQFVLRYNLISDLIDQVLFLLKGHMHSE